MKFYKRAMRDRKSLTRELVVKFCNDDGVNGGAIKSEFFSLDFREIRQRIFQGPKEYILPITDSSKVLLFRKAGMVVVRLLFKEAQQGCQYWPRVFIPIIYP